MLSSCSASAAPVKWADFEGDSVDFGGSAPSASCRPSVPKLRWSDMFSDDECDCRCPPSPASTRASVSGSEALHDSETSETEDVPQAQPLASTDSNNRFARPARQGRRQRNARRATKQSKEAWKHAEYCQEEPQQEEDWLVVGNSQRDGKWQPKKSEFSAGSYRRPIATTQPSASFQRGGKGKRNDEHGHTRRAWGVASENSKPRAAPTKSTDWDAATAVRSANVQCQFFIGIQEDKKFGVVRRILGSHGANMKSIAAQTGSRLRLRGRGSGFLEGPAQQESRDPLMLCVSAPDAVAYQATKDLISELLEEVYEQYRHQCAKEGKAAPKLGVKVHEGYRQGAR